jgi:hypothetical protein
MSSHFQNALLAIEIAVEALHELGPSRDADDALAQIRHLGFETSAERPKPNFANHSPKNDSHVDRIRPTRPEILKQKTLF